MSGTMGSSGTLWDNGTLGQWDNGTMGQWDNAGTMLGQCWDNAGTMLGQCWDNAGTMLGQCWDNAGTMLGQCWDNAGTMLGQCWDNAGTMGSSLALRHFPQQEAVFLVTLCELSWQYQGSTIEFADDDRQVKA